MPSTIVFENGRVKVELGAGRGTPFDPCEPIRRHEMQLDTGRAMPNGLDVTGGG